jgi:hypothetical protein
MMMTYGTNALDCLCPKEMLIEIQKLIWELFPMMFVPKLQEKTYMEFWDKIEAIAFNSLKTIK